VAGTTDVHHHSQFIGWNGLTNFWPGWVSNWYPHHLCFPSIWNYRCVPLHLVKGIGSCMLLGFWTQDLLFARQTPIPWVIPPAYFYVLIDL
jgi:hypothetical protein